MPFRRRYAVAAPRSISRSRQLTYDSLAATSCGVGMRWEPSNLHSPHRAAQVTSNAPPVSSERRFEVSRRSIRSSGSRTGATPAWRFSSERGDSGFHSDITWSTCSNSSKQRSAAAREPGDSGTGNVTRKDVPINGRSAENQLLFSFSSRGDDWALCAHPAIATTIHAASVRITFPKSERLGDLPPHDVVLFRGEVRPGSKERRIALPVEMADHV